MKKYYYEKKFTNSDNCKKSVTRYLRQHMAETGEVSEKTRIHFVDCSPAVMLFVAFDPNVVFFVERDPDTSLRFKRVRLYG